MEQNRHPWEGSGSGVHGGEQQDRTSAASIPQPDAIATLRPWEPPEKIEVRRKLNNCAVLAAARATSAQSPHARVQWWLANEIAAHWTFATADVEALQDVLNGLRRSFMGADAFERNGSGL